MVIIKTNVTHQVLVEIKIKTDDIFSHPAEITLMHQNQTHKGGKQDRQHQCAIRVDQTLYRLPVTFVAVRNIVVYC